MSKAGGRIDHRTGIGTDARGGLRAGRGGRQRTVVLAVAAQIALAGCAVQPTPLTEAATALRVETDLARLAAVQPPLEGPLTLHGALARALLHNPETRVRAMGQALALRQTEVARLGLLPALAGRYGLETRSNPQA